MKNNSVKYKKSVPKSSTDSQISGFEFEASPLPNPNAFETFTHAQNISARLCRTSHFNDLNMRVSTPNCRGNVQQSFIMQDEVLQKSPMNRFQESFIPHQVPVEKFTKQSLEKMKNIELFINNSNTNDDYMVEDMMNKDMDQNTRVGDSADDTQDDMSSRLQEMMSDLRILRNDPIYFESYDGEWAINHPSESNFSAYRTQCGVTVNNGSSLQSLVLEHDTFRVNRICDNPHRSPFSAVCLPDLHFQDWVVCGTEGGQILCWSAIKEMNFRYYQLNEHSGQQCSNAITYIAQQQHNFYVGTDNNTLTVLDDRLNKSSVALIKSNSFQENTPVHTPGFGTTQFFPESPKMKSNKEITQKTQNTPFEMEVESQDDMKCSLLLTAQTQSGIRYIDVQDNSILLTLSNGFSSYDMRNTSTPTFTYTHVSVNSIKALYSPNSLHNIILVDHNSQQMKIWNTAESQVFQQDLHSFPTDMIVAPHTSEVLTLTQDNQVSIFNKRYELSDQLTLPTLPIQKLLLDADGQTLFAMGMYSLRTWNFYDRREMAQLQNQLLNVVKQRKNEQL